MHESTNSKRQRTVPPYDWEDGYEPDIELMNAIEHDTEAVVCALMSKEPRRDPNGSMDQDRRYSPLVWAIACKKYELIQCLLEFGANPSIIDGPIDEMLISPLEWALHLAPATGFYLFDMMVAHSTCKELRVVKDTAEAHIILTKKPPRRPGRWGLLCDCIKEQDALNRQGIIALILYRRGLFSPCGRDIARVIYNIVVFHPIAGSKLNRRRF